MNIIVIGTDHRLQHSDRGFEGLLTGLMAERYFEPLTAVFEEWHENPERSSVAKRLAKERELKWWNLDMTSQEKHDAGILEAQRSRAGLVPGKQRCTHSFG